MCISRLVEGSGTVLLEQVGGGALPSASYQLYILENQDDESYRSVRSP